MPPTLTSPSATASSSALQQRVLNLALEIEQLASSGLPAGQFFALFLEKLVTAVSAQAGAVWLVEQESFQLCCEMRLKSTGIEDTAQSLLFQQRLLSKVAASGQARTVHTDEEPDVAFSNRHLLILAGLRADGVCRGVVEIFLRPDVAPVARSGYLQFVEQMSGYASKFLERASVAAIPSAPVGSQDDLIRFGLQLQRSLVVREVAAVAANDGRLLVGCDRVSVILQRGQAIEIHAVSGQDSVNRRANLMKSIIGLSREVIQSGSAVKYEGKADDFPPQLKERLADLVQESGARLVYAVPLKPPSPLVPSESAEPSSTTSSQAFGCMVLEQFNQSEPTRELIDRLDLVSACTAASLHNAITYQSLFLLPLWRGLGQACDWLGGRNLMKTLSILWIIVLSTWLLAICKLDYRVEGDGRLMPVERREIFVPFDGEVVDVLVSSGERVKKGQSLARLRNNDLRAELIATESQFEEKKKLLAALHAERDEASRNPSGERGHRVEGDLARTMAELKGLEQQQLLLREREQLLNVTSPIDGVISTFEVDRLLRYRPVRRGEILMEVMDDRGPWQLELNVSEHHTGPLFRALALSEHELPIDFLLVTMPELTYHARLKEVGTRVVLSEDNRPVVEVLAALPTEGPVNRRIGAEVRARISCGEYSAGYVLFGDVIDFVRKYFWL